MRKLMCVMLSCMMLLGLTACGGEEEVKNAAVGTFEQNGITITMSFDAKGDKVTRLTQKSVIPTEGYTEEQLQALREVVDQAAATYDDFESVEYTSEEEEGQMVDTFNDWIFDSEHTEGDTGLVENTNSGQYGWHVMYFQAWNDPSWKINAKSAFQNDDMNSWIETITEGYEAVKADGFKYVD